MPKIKASDPHEKPLAACRDLEEWHRGHKCPQTGSRQRKVHYWIPSALNACKHFGLSPDEAAAWVQERMSRDPGGPREISDMVEFVYGTEIGTGPNGARASQPKHEPFNPDKLRQVTAQIDVPDPVQYLRDRSPLPVDIQPSEYLRAISAPGEFRVAMPRQEAFGAEVRLWKDYDRAEVRTRVDARVDELATGSALGAWFLNQPVDGIEQDGSCRRIVNVTAWRYAVLETDEDISPDDWLRFLITLPLAIVSITHSGGRGAHALVRTNTMSKDELEAYIAIELMPLTVYGADHNALTAYRLTRLPNCWRGEKGQMQQLYYLNPGADRAPIYRLSTTTNENEGEEENVNTEQNAEEAGGTDGKEAVYLGTLDRDPDEKTSTLAEKLLVGYFTAEERESEQFNEMLARKALLVTELNQIYGKLGVAMTEAWQKKGLIGPDDPSFLYLAIKDPNKAERISKAYRIREAKAAQCTFHKPAIPGIEPVSKMLVEDIPDAPEIVKGVLGKGCKAVIGGPSKARKTWLLMDFAISVAAGEKWIGFETVKGRVLYVNFELMRSSFKKRTQKIAFSKGIQASDLENLDALNLRGYAAEAKEIIPRIISQAAGRKYSAIILDPTYKMMGDLEENKAGDMAELMNEFEKLATKLDVAVVFAAHFPKGNMAKRESIDRMSGSGVFARDPDAIITMTELSDKERKKLNKQPEKSDKDKSEQDAVRMLALLHRDGLTHGKWLSAVEEGLEFGKSKFNREIKKLVEGGLVEKKGDLYVKTEKGEELVRQFHESVASEIEEDSDDSATEESETTGGGIYKLEFTLRDAPPQKPIAIQFGDWTKDDYVHHRVNINLDGFESSDETDGQGRPEVPCTITYTGNSLCATCTACGHRTTGYLETKAKPGNTLKYCLATMAEQCPRGESNRYVEGDSAMAAKSSNRYKMRGSGD
jgi:hypothetical protein